MKPARPCIPSAWPIWLRGPGSGNVAGGSWPGGRCGNYRRPAGRVILLIAQVVIQLPLDDHFVSLPSSPPWPVSVSPPVRAHSASPAVIDHSAHVDRAQPEPGSRILQCDCQPPSQALAAGLRRQRDRQRAARPDVCAPPTIRPLSAATSISRGAAGTGGPAPRSSGGHGVRAGWNCAPITSNTPGQLRSRAHQPDHTARGRHRQPCAASPQHHSLRPLLGRRTAPRVRVVRKGQAAAPAKPGGSVPGPPGVSCPHAPDLNLLTLRRSSCPTSGGARPGSSGRDGHPEPSR